MLICPQCQFENPDANKFCQQCGTSLTHKTCPDCSTSVVYGAENCPSCGTYTGTAWLAIVRKTTPPIPVIPQGTETKEKKSFEYSPEKLGSAKKDQQQNLDSLATSTPKTPQLGQSPLGDLSLEKPINPVLASQTPEEVQNLPGDKTSPTGIDFNSPPSTDTSDSMAAYLDSQQRYKILESITQSDSSIYVVRVLDLMPLAPSPLGFILDQQNSLSREKESNSDAIALLALPYLELEEQFDPAMPKVHDTWIGNGTEVVLLEDRSSWPMLLDLWRDNQIPQMQLLHMLYDMTSLWVALEGFESRQSLLELTNLRVDEDQTFVLQYLYPDEPANTPTLQSLGAVWQQLFRQTGRTLLGSMGRLMSDLQQDTIDSIDELRLRLEAIASELQADLTPAIAMPPVEPDTNLEAVEDMPEQAVTKQLDPGNEGEDAPTIVLPMQLLSLEDAGQTDVGRARRHNEDYFGIQTQICKLENPFGRTLQAKGMYILCDGMGGHAGGEVASALAVKTLLEYFETHWQDKLPDEDCIRKGVQWANQAIYDVNQQDARSGSGRMGTTLVMVLVQDTQVAVAHVGDSRLYRISRTQSLEQITVDHEVGQRELKRGIPPEIAYSRPDAYQLTQALGPRNAQFVIPDVQFFELDEDTLLLLCSDGLSDNDLIEKNWQTHLKPLLSSRANLDRGANELIELANQCNGHDNITALLIRAKVRPDLEQAKFSHG